MAWAVAGSMSGAARAWEMLTNGSSARHEPHAVFGSLGKPNTGVKHEAPGWQSSPHGCARRLSNFGGNISLQTAIHFVLWIVEASRTSTAVHENVWHLQLGYLRNMTCLTTNS